MRLSYHRVRIRYKRFQPRARYGGLLEGIGVGIANLLGGAGIFGGAAAAAPAAIDTGVAFGPTLADLGIAAAPAAIDTGVAFGPTLADLGIGTAAADTGAAAIGPTLADLGLGTAGAADAAIPTVTAPQLAGVLGATGQDVLPTAATSTLAGSDAAATAAGAAPLGTTLPGAGSIGAASAAAPAGAVAPGVAASVADPTAIASGDLAGGFSGPMASAAPASTAASGGGAAAAGGGSGFNLSSLVSGAKDAATIGAPLVAGAGLLYNIEQSKKSGSPALAPQTAGIESLAEQQAAQGTQLQSYLASGTLPPGLQTGLNQAASAQKAALIQKYANMGMPTDPASNSALAQDISNLNQQVQAQVAQIGTTLYNLGQQGINLSTQDLEYLANLSVSQSQATGNAISNFASALAGMLKPSGSNTLTIKTA